MFVMIDAGPDLRCMGCWSVLCFYGGVASGDVAWDHAFCDCGCGGLRGSAVAVAAAVR